MPHGTSYRFTSIALSINTHDINILATTYLYLHLPQYTCIFSTSTPSPEDGLAMESHQPAGQHIKASATLLGLPVELRLAIWDHFFCSITAYTRRGMERTPTIVTGLSSADEEDDDDHGDGDDEDDDDEDNNDDGAPQISYRFTAKHHISEPPGVPWEVTSIRLVCRTFAEEIQSDQIGSDWHSKITYHFPSTVAFVDVLSQWPQQLLETVRHIHVRDTPLPLYPIGEQLSYHAFTFADALAIFPGLQLETLTVESIWLHANGSEVDDFCLSATFYAIKILLRTKGWRSLRYVSGILGLKPSDIRSIQAAVDAYKSEREEPDFECHFGRIRPQHDGLVTIHANGTRATNTVAAQEIDSWYAHHPEESAPHVYPAVTELQTSMWARRGVHADFKEDGAALSPQIQELLSHMSWVELRRGDQFLVDDGLEDPTGHL